MTAQTYMVKKKFFEHQVVKLLVVSACEGTGEEWDSRTNIMGI